MDKIIIDISSDNTYILLTGDISKLLSHRFALRYIKDYLTPIIEDDRLIVPIAENEPEQVLSKIRTMLKKYGFAEERSDTTNQILDDFYEEERKFDLFSKKAFSIRNNDCNASDFKSFVSSVQDHLPNRTLYELQLLSAYHLAFSQNACNFSAPGAGKTSIVYGAYAYLNNLSDNDSKKVDRLLVIGPLSSFGPWELEYEECFGYAPTVKRLVSTLPKQDRVDYLYSKYTSEITLISYASVASLKDDLCFFLRNNKVMVVLDEAHKTKNTSGGVTAQSVLELAKYCKSRVVLTGTPAPNGYEDLYNMFKFIWPSKNVMGYQINQLRDMSTQRNDPRVDGLIASIAPFFIRIKKSDLGIPPATIHPPIVVDMGPAQRRIYDGIEKRYIDTMLENKELDMSSKFKSQLISAKMIRLMQAATNPAMLCTPLSNFFLDEDMPPEAYRAIEDGDIIRDIMEYSINEIPQKFIEVGKLIQSIIQKDEKVVVWVNFIQTIKDLKQYLLAMGIQSQELYGVIPVEQATFNEDESEELTREKIVREFHRPDCPYGVIIANPFAVAESISLHKACHNAIYMERTFNAAHFMQSKDRIHRYGLNEADQTNYFYVISKDSIDETIDERLREKERRMIEIMESMPIPLFDNMNDDFGDEDIKALVKSYVKRYKKA